MHEGREVEPAPAKPQEDEDRERPAKESPLADDVVDEVVAASFPASDPPPWWAGGPD